jgi:deoxyribodipyrimidine photo-lyase
VDTAIVVITRDLRVHDNPALALACAAARQVVPVFVADPALAVPPNRGRFLAQTGLTLEPEPPQRRDPGLQPV